MKKTSLEIILGVIASAVLVFNAVRSSMYGNSGTPTEDYFVPAVAFGILYARDRIIDAKKALGRN